MNYKELQIDISKKQLRPVYLFTGEEEYLMDIYIDKIKDSVIDEATEMLNYTVIDGKDKEFDEILNACETLPFMADKKMVVIKNLMELIENNKDLSERLNEYIPKVEDHVVLILKDKNNSLKRNTKLFKSISKVNGVVDFKKLGNTELVGWINKLLKANKKTISNSDLNYFIKKSTYTEYRSEKKLNELENELIKIINHSNGEIIGREDIDSNFVEVLDMNIFNFLDSLVEKNTEKAMEIFNEMYKYNEPIPRILYMIIRQLRLMLKYKVFKSRGYNDIEIRNKLGIKQYEYGKISKNSRSYLEDDLKDNLDYILEMDRRQKSTYQDEKLAMEILIVKLTS